MTYDQALLFLNNRIGIGWKLGLESMRRMLNELDSPHRKTKFIHIAGTNGKGSVAAMLASIFRAAGYKTGLYTSPHLVDVRERIRLNGALIGENDFARFLAKIKPVIEKYNATYFETLTTLAFYCFAKEKLDMVVLEVGLGGRLDATNVVDPELAIITSIALEHTDYLGHTLSEIAGEKAGIIKRNCPCLIGILAPEAALRISEIADKQQAPLYSVQDLCQYKIERELIGETTFRVNPTQTTSDEYKIPLNGDFQVGNACLAIAACNLLGRGGWDVKHRHIVAGLNQIGWPARFQVIRRNPLMLFDVAHNVASIEQLVQLLERFCADKKIYIIFGVLKDKDYHQMVQHLATVAFAVQPVAAQSERSFPAQELHDVLKHHKIKTFPPNNVSRGIKRILSEIDENDVLCVTGSHYVVGEAITAIKVLTK